MAHVARTGQTFASSVLTASALTRQNLDKHEKCTDGDTDASSQTGVDAVVSEVSSVVCASETERHVDCGYHTDDDMYHPVYYMAIPPQVVPGNFVPALPTIPQSPMAPSNLQGLRFLPETPTNSIGTRKSSCASETAKPKMKEIEQRDEKQEVQRKRSSKKSNTSSILGTTAVPQSVAETPRKSDGREEPELAVSERTTVMLKNLPKGLSRSMLLDLLHQKGFAKHCNFVYLPVEFTRRSCMGYAFVNFVEPSVVSDFWNVFEGLTDWPVPSSKICKVTWSSPLQGLSEHVDRFRNSPLMHSSVPDECRPILLHDGIRLTFPPPTKTLRAPRPRASRSMRPFWQGGEGGDADMEDI